MGKVLKAVAFVAAAGALIATGGVLGAIGKTLLVNGALSLASRLLMGKRKGFSSPQNVMVRSSVAPREIVYGLVRKSGVLVFAKTAGTNNEHMDYVIALAGHQVDAITDVWFDDVKIADADINPSTGVISGASKFAGKALIFKYLGTSTQAANSLLDSTYSEWGSGHQLKGIAYLHIRFTFDSSVYQAGPPQNIYATVKGKRVYDPRLDSTNGGSGSQRYSDATTWAWSNNPALCAADYITGGSMTFDIATPSANLGFGADPARMDWTSVVASANVCDESVSPVIYTDISQSRYLCDGVLSTGAVLADNMDDILSSMAGRVVRSNGLYRVFAGDYETPAIALTEADIIGRVQVTTRHSRGELYNAVKGTYFSSAVWQQTEFRSREDTAYESADGGQYWRDIDLPMTVNGYRAQRIAELILRQSRNQIVVTGDFALTAFQVGLWDTLTLSIAELAWSAKVFRCIGWEFNPEGTIKLTLREESASAYTDIAGSEDSFGDYLPDYSTDSDPGTPASDTITPALISTSAAGNMTVIGTGGAQTTLAPGADGTVLMIDAGQATKMRWGPTGTPAKGDLFAVSDDGTTITLTRVPVGADDDVLIADSAENAGVKWGPQSGGGSGVGTNPATNYVLFDDMDGARPASTSDEPWTSVNVGTSAQVTDEATADAGHPGVWTLNTGTLSSGNCTISRSSDPAGGSGVGGYQLDGSALTVEWLIRVPTLSTATQKFEVNLGLASYWGDWSAGSLTRGVWCRILWTGAPDIMNFQLETKSAGFSTISQDTTSPLTTAWTLVKLVCTSSSCSLVVGTTTLLTNTVNIPGLGLQLGANIRKSLGTSNRTMDIDLVRLSKAFSSSRY